MSDFNPFGRPLVASVKTEPKDPAGNIEYIIKFHTTNNYDSYKDNLSELSEVLIRLGGDDYKFTNINSPTQLGTYGFSVTGSINGLWSPVEEDPITLNLKYTKSSTYKTTTNYDVSP